MWYSSLTEYMKLQRVTGLDTFPGARGLLTFPKRDTLISLVILSNIYGSLWPFPTSRKHGKGQNSRTKIYFILFLSVISVLIVSCTNRMGWLQFFCIYVYKPPWQTTHNSSTRSDEGLTLEMSAFESLYGGQFTLSTQLIKPNYFVYYACCLDAQNEFKYHVRFLLQRTG